MLGPLTFATVSQHLQKDWQGEVSLAGVTQLDSAGLSLMLEMKRRANAQGAMLGFTEVPPAVHRLADHFGISGMLELKK